VANAVTDKLIARHPYVFGTADVPTDMMATWEDAKRTAKRRDSALDGIADALPTLARAAKVATRLRDTHNDVALPGPEAVTDGKVDEASVGQTLLAEVVRAVQAGVDPDQALRDATRKWENQVREAGV